MSSYGNFSRVAVLNLALANILCLIPAARGAGSEDPVESVKRSWDLERATKLVIRLRGDAGPDAGECALDLARADLAAASMLRVELEAAPPEDRGAKRALGLRIDVFAKEGLDALSGCPDSSERWRFEADLLATMIRSDFRAKKYEKQLKSAIEQALAIDDGNAHAWVASAKPFLFADARHGGDFEEGISRLDRALELHPGLESALVLRAYAHEQLGHADASRTDLEEALRLNPICRPARLALSNQTEPPS